MIQDTPIVSVIVPIPPPIPVDLTVAAEFVQKIWGTDEGYFRLFHDSDKSKKPGNITGKYSQFKDYFKSMNDLGYGIFAVINSGGHSDKEIIKYNAVFIDIDGGGLPSKWHQPPNIIFQRENNVHAYWLLPQPNDYHEIKFRTVQKQLAQYYNSDPKVINPSRVMRLPGFKHNKIGVNYE